MTDSADMLDELIAVGEIAGRLSLQRFPIIRRAAGKWARRAPPHTASVKLSEIRERIIQLGYQPGTDLLVHSSFVRHLEGGLDELITMLRAMVGDTGTLLMPSHPVLGSREGVKVYDVQRSRSRVGLLTERFRKTPGVLRSSFPIAPVCAFGVNAADYTRDFRADSKNTAYGRGSPYHLIGERNGKVLFLGIDFIRALTLEHVAFDVLENNHPIADYYQEQAILVSCGGREECWNVRDHREGLAVRLATMAMRRKVLRSGTIQCETFKGVQLGVMNAAAFLHWHLPLARSRGWPYWTVPRVGSK